MDSSDEYCYGDQKIRRKRKRITSELRISKKNHNIQNQYPCLNSEKNSLKQIMVNIPKSDYLRLFYSNHYELKMFNKIFSSQTFVKQRNYEQDFEGSKLLNSVPINSFQTLDIIDKDFSSNVIAEDDIFRMTNNFKDICSDSEIIPFRKKCIDVHMKTTSLKKEIKKEFVNSPTNVYEILKHTKYPQTTKHISHSQPPLIRSPFINSVPKVHGVNVMRQKTINAPKFWLNCQKLGFLQEFMAQIKTLFLELQERIIFLAKKDCVDVKDMTKFATIANNFGLLATWKTKIDNHYATINHERFNLEREIRDLELKLKDRLERVRNLETKSKYCTEILEK